MPYCRYCGSMVEEDANFCSVCGNPTFPDGSRPITPPFTPVDPIADKITLILRLTFYGFVVMTILLIGTSDSDSGNIMTVILSCLGPYIIYRMWKNNHRFGIGHYLLLIPPIFLIGILIFLGTLINFDEYDGLPRFIFGACYFVIPTVIYIALPIWLRFVRARNHNGL